MLSFKPAVQLLRSPDALPLSYKRRVAAILVEFECQDVVYVISNRKVIGSTPLGAFGFQNICQKHDKKNYL